ncbi:MAG: hypothetical protein LUF30_01455 [Lachnospiraceae bacterium]|nr:hypothetical protein [Lachnospiraceae bacterium]
MLSELDQIANQNHLQLIKAIIPHLPRARQKTFSILIKIIELQNILKYYASSPAAVHACCETDPDLSRSASRDPSSPFSHTADEADVFSGEQPSDMLDILTDIREHCEGEEQAMIDQALQMLSMIELYSLFAQQEGEIHE